MKMELNNLLFSPIIAAKVGNDFAITGDYSFGPCEKYFDDVEFRDYIESLGSTINDFEEFKIRLNELRYEFRGVNDFLYILLQ